MYAHIIVDGRVERTDSAETIRGAHAAGQTMWAEIGEPSREAEQLLTETFGVHPLVVEDIFGERSVPKIDQLASFYGMNFASMPFTSSRWGYLGVLGVMMVVSVGVWSFFKRRGWT